MNPCEAILILSESWKDECRPIISPESDSRLAQWEETNGKISDWMEETETTATAGYRRVLEYWL
jgi:hypothetical protein